MASSKKKTIYRCVDCGHTEVKWLGRCPNCGQWNSLREGAAGIGEDRAGETFPLPIAAIDAGEGVRFASGFSELDRVLGGGVMRGSVVLIGGEPGIGKSTLLLQLCARIAAPGKIMYISGEESPAQIKLRADRLGALREELEVFCTSSLARIRGALETQKPSVVIIDSVQTLHAEEAGAIPGTANQIKYCTQELTNFAKENNMVLFLVAHVTKEGIIAGPKAAEHLVDTVLSFEQSEAELRIIRAQKNRFGSCEEIGIFRMLEVGLEEVLDPSGLFLVRREGGLPSGTAVAAVHEGSRCILVEIQALTVPAKAGLTRVYSERIDSGRVARIAAVLEKQTGMRFADQDIYVNVAGGIRLTEPGIDLALACALYSARADLPLPEKSACAGELSLAGELRPVRNMRRRSKAATSLGLTNIFGPSGEEGAGKEWQIIKEISSGIKIIFGAK